MLEIPALPENPIEKPPHEEQGGGVVVSDGSKAEHGEDGDRNSSANRWPREETMALIKIRSEMDTAFKDANPKAPLWEQISRKLAEVGYERSAKKCREKFENIYKYHRRTKEGRNGQTNTGKSKTYRFFEQLEALDNTQTQTQTLPSVNNVIRDAVPCSVRFPVEHSTSTTSSSSEEGVVRKKRKLTQFFEGLMREVVERQESLQRKLMEALDKSERERMAREEAWKVEELARIKRERELLAHERSIAAAKDEAVLAFLKKFSDNNNNNNNTVVQLPEKTNTEISNEKEENWINDEIREIEKKGCEIRVGNYNNMNVSSSRWPKDEVEALIRLRTEMEVQSQNGLNSKGPLWEDISSGMKKIGYDRSAKRCKEKWENINKYFKRMKVKNRRKPMDSKTCPYYHHLEALYSNKKVKKGDHDHGDQSVSSENNNNNSNNIELRPEELLMHIMEGSQHESRQSSCEEEEDGGDDDDAGERREKMDQNQEDDQGGYQMLDNSTSSVAIMSST